ncbi:hypothetical protein C1645_732458 [Glomus cerebriforme]|uniref:Uncharacterized protein n=1 Tax=Glomus cerebriforme TaxID=658196 RepID=A0A397TLQ3_9GLOM|nr:hypothetical protein C1645_732458 [Glomus cerebriforme]
MANVKGFHILSLHYSRFLLPCSRSAWFLAGFLFGSLLVLALELPSLFIIYFYFLIVVMFTISFTRIFQDYPEMAAYFLGTLKPAVNLLLDWIFPNYWIKVFSTKLPTILRRRGLTPEEMV